MSLQNKVDPQGQIHANAMRGKLMGNRGGRFHDPKTQQLLSRRHWVSRQWICCLTTFKNRNRKVMGTGYTELFFLDEVSAFAAGHRPCFECRYAGAKRFAAHWADAHQLDRPPRASEMDRILHQQRLDGRSKRIVKVDADTLPDGAVIKMDAHFYARQQKQWIQWSWHGYGESAEISSVAVILLTPPAIVAVLKSGYKPGWY